MSVYLGAVAQGWMENFPLHLVKKIAKGGKGIDPVGRRVAQAELQRRKQRSDSH